ncbi:hypothetical protein [Corynebacterium otitidis]|uniref:Putative membrane protein n=1 Tax=Corynebacterium otitidis ATCC 51513 TaxID=883169 RepID=I7L9U6_9CORY|nr:hypothetical protein [Corynebacterium otitidis]EJZ81455.1 hypothetical protein HMPREF9719_01642 [Corynebacterium otitidis ATCC 51513]KKO83613.1 membrane protein [Corynebacterium otitidis]CCI84077.1 putative membrane protein [Corynebacterium otitidis ATCC 51513]
MSTSPATAAAREEVADTRNESFPAYDGQMRYIEGYDPVSYEAPHSSLLRAETWIGMGLALMVTPFLGTLMWVGGMATIDNAGVSDLNLGVLLTIGIVGTVFFVAAAALAIRFGRRYYFKYRRETGRLN